MKRKYLILGATGGIGFAFTNELLNQGIETDILVRNKEKAERLFNKHPLLTIHSGDVNDPGSMAAASSGVDVIFHGINYPYHLWDQYMKPVTSMVIKIAEQQGATILFPGNIYAYGNISSPINEKTIAQPTTKKGSLRFEIEKMLEAAAVKGNCRVINLRLPDFYGPNVTNGLIKPLFGNAAEGISMKWMIRSDVPHQFAYTPDAASIYFKLSQEKNLPPYYVLNYGGIVVPSVSELTKEISYIAGSPNKLKLYSKSLLKLLGMFIPVVRELRENIYQFEHCIKLDDNKLRSIYPEFVETPLAVSIENTIRWYRSD